MSRAATAAIAARRSEGHGEARSHLFNTFTVVMGVALLLSVTAKAEPRGTKLAGVRTAVELLDKRFIAKLGPARDAAIVDGGLGTP